MHHKYRIEILDSSLNPITRVQAPVALDSAGYILEYSTRLSDVGTAKFRIATTDPLWNQYGDIAQPYVNHVRIYRGTVNVWQGIIIDCPHRTAKYIEIEAYTYLFLLSKVLIRHDTSGDINYRTLNSGTMATTVQTLLTEGKADAGNLLSNMTFGTIENPKFPQGFVNFQNQSVAGQDWVFNDNFNIKYDYRDLLYVIQSLGLYGLCDFELVNDPLTNKLTFNFKLFLGNKQPDLMFEYSLKNGAQYGSIEDFDAPLNGKDMANHIVGVAADLDFKILKIDQSDTASITKYGKLDGVAAYADVKSSNLLTNRVNEQLVQVSTPDAEINPVLNDRAYPVGVWGTGDIITLRIKNHIIDITKQRRVVGTDIRVHGTGKEKIQMYTNPPRPGQG